VVLAHSFIGGSRQSTAQKEEILGTGKETWIQLGWLQRTPRRPGSLRGVICSARAGDGVSRSEGTWGVVSFGELFPQV
jgi:hypothetical protein